MNKNKNKNKKESIINKLKEIKESLHEHREAAQVIDNIIDSIKNAKSIKKVTKKSK